VCPAQVLHDLATALLSCSTGIDPEAVAANVDKLASWNRCISADALDVLIGYLAATDSESVLSLAISPKQARIEG